MSLEDARPPNVEEREVAVVHLLQRVWAYPMTTKSDDARAWADEIAEAASRELLTTAVVPPPGKIFGRIWKLTPAGLSHLFANGQLISSEEDAYVARYCR